MNKSPNQAPATNKVSYEGDIKDLIFVPFKDEGLKLVGSLDFVWKTFPRPRISGGSCSAIPEVHDKISKFFNQSPKQKEFSNSVMFNAQLAVYEDVTFRKSYVQIGEKYLLNGPSGLRFMSGYVYEADDREGRQDREKKLVAFFDEQQAKNKEISPQCVDPEEVLDMDYAIECRNMHNYYHYITETMSQLAVLDQIAHRGRIFIHSVDADRKRSQFTRAFVDAVFPHMSERLEFQSAPKHYGKVLSTFNFDQCYYLYADSAVPSIDALVPKDSTMWKGKTATLSSQKLLKQNLTNTAHLALRRAAEKQLEGKDFSHLPKRIFVTRDPAQNRTRDLAGGEELLSELKELGFERVVFEQLPIIEQIAVMHNAEIMISGHGAGFANMMFAGSDTCAIEIGTLQTTVFRWLDFWLHAAISGCSYRYFAADHDTEHPEKEPKFKDEGIVPARIPDDGINAIRNYIAALLGAPLKIDTARSLTILAAQMMRSGDIKGPLAIIADHSHLLETSADLSLLHAELLRSVKMFEDAFANFARAYTINNTKPYPFFQTIFLARRKSDWTYIQHAIKVLELAHPKPLERFLRAQKWINLEEISTQESSDFYFAKIPPSFWETQNRGIAAPAVSLDLPKAQVLCVGVHHKTGSMWMFNTFKKISKRLDIVMNPPNTSVTNIDERLAEHKRVIMVNLTSDFRPEMLQRPDVTGIHLIRDPRDILTSGMTYHARHQPKGSSREPFLHKPREDLGNLTYQQFLNSLPDTFSKYRFEMFQKHQQTLQEMCKWDYTNPSIFEWKYEDLIVDEACRMFTQAMQRFDLTDDEVAIAVNCFWENSLFGGLKRNKVSGEQHIQSGQKERWKTELPLEVQRLYQAAFGQELIHLEYETSNDWINEG